MVKTEREFTRSLKSETAHAKDFDYIELYVGNAKQAAHFYRTALGFKPIAYAGLETGERDRVSFILEQGEIRLVLTASITPDSAVAEHVLLHGDGVRDIAFAVDDAAMAFEIAVERGAEPILEPTVIEDEASRIIKATIGAFGHTVHSFIQRSNSQWEILPHYQPLPASWSVPATSLSAIDHVAISVEEGQLDRWIDFYRDVLGFHLSHQEDISTSHSAMNSKVVQNKLNNIKLPIMQPAPGLRKSQIQEYLTFHKGPGAQHLAFSSADIVNTVRALQANSVEFLRTPDTYYDMLGSRVGKVDQDIKALRELGILVDRDDWGYLLQIFTKPLQTRPTLFVEIIQRVEARGFGGGNIKALFEAIEREQAIRGTL